ncbi:hypothetical protein RFI_17826 [Reticulomyxa filosa]|uniref:Uncharacterized protein n=1 Tax=Reticulomyxa filosa TaxID=46433 RepID=X6N131_RETFI|nr:hypothetical protein RFI_17826 [Reticulomyxa filosa]|eukprot:ETO19414.1 hypothetical protein RFI_17826 [Reticulomyxa filosa]
MAIRPEEKKFKSVPIVDVGIGHPFGLKTDNFLTLVSTFSSLDQVERSGGFMILRPRAQTNEGKNKELQIFSFNTQNDVPINFHARYFDETPVNGNLHGIPQLKTEYETGIYPQYVVEVMDPIYQGQKKRTSGCKDDDKQRKSVSETRNKDQTKKQKTKRKREDIPCESACTTPSSVCCNQTSPSPQKFFFFFFLEWFVVCTIIFVCSFFFFFVFVTVGDGIEVRH